MNAEHDIAARYPLTLFYDASCPVCALEMDHLRERDIEGRLIFVDIGAPGFDAAAPLIHALRAQRAWRTVERMNACTTGPCAAGRPAVSDHVHHAGRTS